VSPGPVPEPNGAAPPLPRRPRAFTRLYRGETSFDFMGRKRWWFTLSAVIIVAGVLSVGIRGLNFGIDFKGGTSWEVTPINGATVTQVQNAVTRAGLTTPTVEILGGRTVQVQADLNGTSASQEAATSARVEAAMAAVTHTRPSDVSITTVGPSWGGTVTSKAIEALVVFFILIGIYISIRFEWKMAVAAILAVLHDILVTVGVYSLVGFQVTPDTVIAVLTILGYSLYDTVVVFDRVRENARGVGASGRMTYSDMVNLSMNQTLARSLNTSLVAILPVFAILVVGAEILGATTLQDFGLALLVGLISGAYSSIFIASPALALLKEREPRYATIRQRLATRADRLGALSPAAAAAMASASAAAGARPSTAPAAGDAQGGRAGSAGGRSGRGGTRASRRGGRPPARTVAGAPRSGAPRAGSVQPGPLRPSGSRPARAPEPVDAPSGVVEAPEPVDAPSGRGGLLRPSGSSPAVVSDGSPPATRRNGSANGVGRQVGRASGTGGAARRPTPKARKGAKSRRKRR